VALLLQHWRKAVTGSPACSLMKCRNYKTWLTTIIPISKPSNRTRLRWHSSIVFTHLRPRVADLHVKHWSSHLFSPSFLPSTRPNSKTFNFHVLKKKVPCTSSLRVEHHSFQLILLLNLSKTMPEKNKRM
jgi:hypothetical protein